MKRRIIIAAAGAAALVAAGGLVTPAQAGTICVGVERGQLPPIIYCVNDPRSIIEVDADELDEYILSQFGVDHEIPPIPPIPPTP